MRLSGLPSSSEASRAVAGFQGFLPVVVQRQVCLGEFDSEVEGWLPVLPEVRLPSFTGADLPGVTAGSLDGWGWSEMKALPELWLDELARILAVVEEGGVGPEGLLDAL